MFTGIIKAKGTVSGMIEMDGDVRVSISAEGITFADFEEGESIAVNGVCLTAIALRPDGFDADVSTETLNVTALGGLAVGAAVNLEPSLAVGDRLGGHFVSGHVDCVGRVAALVDDARSTRMRIEIPSAFRKYIASKGSICIDGVSLTINDVSADHFEVNIIPHTMQETTIGGYKEGAAVNIEVDLLARYLERLLTTDDPELSIDFLKAHGYA